MSKSAQKPSAASPIAATSAVKRPVRPGKGYQSKVLNHSSKQSRVVALLRSKNGTTIDAMMKTTGWQQHSVRGFLAGVVRKRLKLKLSSRIVDNNRVYYVAGDSGTKSSNSQAKKH